MSEAEKQTEMAEAGQRQLAPSDDPRMPPAMQLWTKRIERDDKRIGELEADVEAFLEELENKVLDLKRLYGQQEAAS